MVYKQKIFLIGALVFLLAILGFMRSPKEVVEPQLAMQSILDKTADGKKVYGTSFAVKKGSFYWEGAAGKISEDQAYFIASVTKLYTAAIVFQLQAEGKLVLEDKIATYLDSSLLKGLHVYKGRDYAYDITIRQLLSHTSGLSDYFQGTGPNGRSLEEELINGTDQFWTFEQMLERSKSIEPYFAPGQANKAHYSDTNYQLLGKIIEILTKQSYAATCDARIIKPLKLKHTYIYQDTLDQTPFLFYNKKRELHIPQAMSAFGPDGSIVSTSRELLVFTEAFFTGKLFPKAYLEGLQTWNPIFNPMQAGIGIQRMKLPWIFNPSGSMPTLIGHIGLSGVVAFHSPADSLFIVGTVNQIAYPSTSIQTTLKLARQVLKD